MSDKRRRQYVPLFSGFAVEGTGPKLLHKFGKDGLLTWVCVLAAAKRARDQGTFDYVSEDGGWQELGLTFPNTPVFTLDEFFTFTGHLKKTRKTLRGQLKHIEITGWEEWNDIPRRESEAARKASKRAQNTADKEAPLRRDYSADAPHEVELEVEGEGEENPKGFSEIVDSWLGQAPPLMKHRESIRDSAAARRAVAKAIKAYGIEDVAQAIANYAQVLGSPAHFFDYRWTLPDFLTRGVHRFVPEANPLENFRARVIAQGKDRGVGIADIHRILSEGGSDGTRTVPVAGITQSGVSEPDAA